MRFEVRGVVGGETKVVLEHVTRLRDDLAPDWPQPTGHGGYRVVITGEPNYTVDMQMLGSDGDHNTAGPQGHRHAAGQRGRRRRRRPRPACSAPSTSRSSPAGGW